MIVFKAIQPATKFQSKAFREQFDAAMHKIAPRMLADMKRPTKTWNPPVEFEVDLLKGVKAAQAADAPAHSGLAIAVTTDDRRFLFVDEGTKVRYATMSKDFVAKTKPKSLIARKGRGGLLFVNKKRPRPGIKPRGFTKLVKKKWQPQFTKEMNEALAAGRKQSGHST